MTNGVPGQALTAAVAANDPIASTITSNPGNIAALGRNTAAANAAATNTEHTIRFGGGDSKAAPRPLSTFSGCCSKTAGHGSNNAIGNNTMANSAAIRRAPPDTATNPARAPMITTTWVNGEKAPNTATPIAVPEAIGSHA